MIYNIFTYIELIRYTNNTTIYINKKNIIETGLTRIKTNPIPLQKLHENDAINNRWPLVLNGSLQLLCRFNLTLHASHSLHKKNRSTLILVALSPHLIWTISGAVYIHKSISTKSHSATRSERGKNYIITGFSFAYTIRVRCQKTICNFGTVGFYDSLGLSAAISRFVAACHLIRPLCVSVEANRPTAYVGGTRWRGWERESGVYPCAYIASMGFKSVCPFNPQTFSNTIQNVLWPSVLVRPST